MKFTKLSLVAAIAVSSAFAGGDIAPVEPAAAPVEAASPWSFSGDAKLYYSTDDAAADLFSKESAIGQAAISADIGYAINNNWKINAGLTGLATLGLDDSVVSGVWLYAGANADESGTLPLTSVGDALWIDTLNVTGTAFDGKATFVIGRQELDTPLAFTETWNIANNTFDAAVALVKPTDAITLVAGYIYDGNGNGARISTFDSHEGGFTHDDGYIPAVADKGAWTVAAVATISDVTVQAWYYDVMDIADAVWAQADAKVAGFALGAQYAWIGPKDNLDGAEDSSGWAVKAGYDVSGLNLWAAYSSVDSDGALPIANTATILNGAGVPGVAYGWGQQSKLYTEAWWNYGSVGVAGSDSFAVAANYKLANYNLGAQYTTVSNDDTADVEVDELTLLAGTELMGLDVQLAYIYSDRTVGGDSNMLQAYLTYKF